MLGMVATHSALLQLDRAWKAASSPCSWWPGDCCCAVTRSSYPSTSLASTVNTAATSLDTGSQDKCCRRSIDFTIGFHNHGEGPY